MPSSLRENGVVAPPTKRFREVFDPHGDLGGSRTESSTSPGPTLRKTRVERSWANLPNYRALLKSGAVLPDNGYSYTESNHDISSIVIGDRLQSGTYLDNGVSYPYFIRDKIEIPGGNLIGPEFEASTVTFSEVASKILARAKDNSFNAPLFVAEAHKTASMVVNTASTMVHMLRDLKRGNVIGFMDRMLAATAQQTRDIGLANNHRPSSKAKPLSPSRRQRIIDAHKKDYPRDPSGAAANAWLATQYGWLPFMMDIHDAALALQDLCSVPTNQVARVTATVRNNRTVESKNHLVQVSPEMRADVTRQFTDERRIVWRFRPGPSFNLAKLGLTNPAVVAWELIPFSFVADWFLPIGDYLEGLDAPTAFQHAGGTSGTKVEISTTARFTHLEGYDSFYGGVTAHSARIKRDVLTDIPTPQLSDIRFKNGLKDSIKRMASSVSLLRQNIPRTFGRR